jgi:predicted amidophosphoribosyltransferase
VDVYLLANAQRPSGENFLVCHTCGQKLDPDLSFCPWCTAILE